MLPLKLQLVPPSSIPQGAHDRHVSTPVTQKIKRFTSPNETGHKWSFGCDSEKHLSVLCFVSGVVQGNRMHGEAQGLLKAAHPGRGFNSLCHGRAKEAAVRMNSAAPWLQPPNSSLLFGVPLERLMQKKLVKTPPQRQFYYIMT